MKRVIILSLILGFTLVGSSSGESNLVFGVKPGNMINSAYMGLKIGNLVPMIGADMMWLSASAKYKHENLDSWYDSYDDITYKHRDVDTEDLKGSAFLLVPHIGAKLLMGSKDMRPYVFGNLFFSIPSVNAESNSRNESWYYEDGVEVDHYLDTDSDRLDAKTEEVIKDALSFWGMTLAGGAEYFFSDHFSVGGEYGIRLLFNTAEYKDTSGNGPDPDYQETWEGEVSASFKISYALVALNYYF